MQAEMTKLSQKYQSPISVPSINSCYMACYIPYKLLGSGKSGNSKATSKCLFNEKVIVSEFIRTEQLLDSKLQQM